MKESGRFPGLLPHVLRAINERKEGGGVNAMSHVENAIRSASKTVDPSRDTYTMRRRRRKVGKHGWPHKSRPKKRGRSHSTDIGSFFSDGEDDELDETDSAGERSRSRTPEPLDKSKRRKKKGGGKKRRRRHRSHH